MRFAFTVLCFALLSGCYVREPVGRPLPVDEILLVRYTPPKEVRLVEPGDSGKTVLVRELQGRSRRVSGDTIFLVVTRGRDVNGDQLRGSTAIVTIGPGMKIDTVRFNGQKTSAVAIYGGAILYAAFRVLLVYALST